MVTKPDAMTKREIMKSLDKLPDDATVDDFIDHLYVILKVEKGLAAGRAGKKVPVEEVRRRIQSWSE